MAVIGLLLILASVTGGSTLQQLRGVPWWSGLLAGAVVLLAAAFWQEYEE
jgi:hypothetical protein